MWFCIHNLNQLSLLAFVSYILYFINSIVLQPSLTAGCSFCLLIFKDRSNKVMRTNKPYTQWEALLSSTHVSEYIHLGRLRTFSDTACFCQIFLFLFQKLFLKGQKNQTPKQTGFIMYITGYSLFLIFFFRPLGKGRFVKLIWGLELVGTPWIVDYMEFI